MTQGTSLKAGLNQPNHVNLPEWIDSLTYGYSSPPKGEVPGGIAATLRVQWLLYMIVKVQANYWLIKRLRLEANEILKRRGRLPLGEGIGNCEVLDVQKSFINVM